MRRCADSKRSRHSTANVPVHSPQQSIGIRLCQLVSHVERRRAHQTESFISRIHSCRHRSSYDLSLLKPPKRVIYASVLEQRATVHAVNNIFEVHEMVVVWHLSLFPSRPSRVVILFPRYQPKHALRSGAKGFKRRPEIALDQGAAAATNGS